MNAIKSLSINNFTAFREAEFEFSPGINVLIGENSTGKTQILKLIYTILKLVEVDTSYVLFQQFERVFNIEKISNLVRKQVNGADKQYEGKSGVVLRIGSSEINISFWEDAPIEGLSKKGSSKTPGVIFLPGHEVLSIYPGFIAAYQKRELSFDETIYDLCVALNANPLRKEKFEEVKHIVEPFETVFDDLDSVSIKNDNFYVKLPDTEDLVAQLVAEGYRKLATLTYLVRNGSLTPESILLWDEPEANLNPKLVRIVVEFLLNLANAGAQIFIATHDYLLSQELSLEAEYRGNTNIKFFSLYRERGKDGVLVESGDTLVDIQNNPILEGFITHYEREEQLSYAVS
jgi:predicted ATPase